MEPWVPAFIEHLRATGLERSACVAARVSYRHMRDYKDSCIEFQDAYDDAINEAHDALEREARRRAVDGIEKGIYYQGALVAYEQQYSDTLLTTLLKAKRPDEFAERKQITGRNGAPLQIAVRAFNPDGTIGERQPTLIQPHVLTAEYQRVVDLADPPRTPDTLDLQDLLVDDLV